MTHVLQPRPKRHQPFSVSSYPTPEPEAMDVDTAAPATSSAAPAPATTQRQRRMSDKPTVGYIDPLLLENLRTTLRGPALPNCYGRLLNLQS